MGKIQAGRSGALASVGEFVRRFLTVGFGFCILRGNQSRGRLCFWHQVTSHQEACGSDFDPLALVASATLPHCRKGSFSLGEKKWPRGDLLRPRQAAVHLRVSLRGFGVLFIFISHPRSEMSSGAAVYLHRCGPCIFSQFLPLEERPPL